MNKSKLLGYVVVGYAFLTAGGLLGIVFAPLDWEDILGGVAWLLLSIGGIGLILGKHWGRVLTLAASVVMLIGAVAVVVDEMYVYDSLLFTVGLVAVAALPPLALFVAAVLVKIPRPPQSSAQLRKPSWTRRRASRDVAYAAFIFLGLAALYVARMFFLFSEDSEDSLYAFLVFGFIGFGIPLLIAVLLGPCLSIFLWRDTSLMLLLAATVVASVLLVSASLHSWDWILLPYGVLSLGAGVLWFVRNRRKFREFQS